MPTQTDWVAHMKTSITKTPVLGFEFSSTVTVFPKCFCFIFSNNSFEGMGKPKEPV